MESSLSCSISALLASTFLLIFYSQVVSASGKDLRKVLIQSSNNATFSYISLSDDTDQQDTNEQTNETWKSTGFEIRNITTLLSEYPQLSHSLPLKNSSRFLSSQMSSASLTISLESFKHGVMFLNFSYFIVKGSESLAAHSAPLNKSTDSVALGKNVSSLTNDKEIEMYNTTVYSPVSNLELSKKKSFPSAESNRPSLPISASSPSESKMSGPIVLINSRKRRTVSLDTSSTENQALSTSATNDDQTADSNEQTENFESTTETAEEDTQGSIDVNVNTGPTTNIERLTESATLDSISLVEAVEMLKSAAAAIKSVTKPVANQKSRDIGPAVTNPPVASNWSLEDTAEDVTENSVQDAPTESKLKIASAPASRKQTAEVEQPRHIRRNKSKNVDSNEVLKGASKKRNGKEKKIDNPERAKKDKHYSVEDGVNDHNRRSSSSSSSSSEERDQKHQTKKEEEKPKISYEMWRASLEKKNRPPGLYVTVNDDIIFDNWEGLWDKSFLLGKWSGSKWKPSENGRSRWNQTSVFLNWDGQTNGRDIKIKFEWEPVGNLELILSDIDISTFAPQHEVGCATAGKLIVTTENIPIDPTSTYDAKTHKTTIQPSERYVEMEISNAPIVLKQSSGNGNAADDVPGEMKPSSEKVTKAPLESTTKASLLEQVVPPTKPQLGTTPKAVNETNDESLIVIKHKKNGKDGWEVVVVDNNVTLNVLQTTVPPPKESDEHSEKRGNPEDLLQAILTKLNGNIYKSTTNPPPGLSELLLNVSSNNEVFMKKVLEANLTSLLIDLRKALLESMNHSESVNNNSQARTFETASHSNKGATTKTTSEFSTKATTSTSEISSSTEPTSSLQISDTSTIASSVTTQMVLNTDSRITSVPAATAPTVTSSSPVPPTNIPSLAASHSNSTEPLKPVSQSKKIHVGRRIVPTKTDGETALLVSILTGSIAAVILVMLVKKRIDISNKNRNAV